MPIHTSDASHAIVAGDEAFDDTFTPDIGGDFLPGPSGESSRSSADHARDQKKAKLWLDKHPLSSLALLRLCIRPLMDLMGNILLCSGQQWDIEQQAQILKQRATGGASKPYNRDYQLTFAADGLLERGAQKFLLASIL